MTQKWRVKKMLKKFFARGKSDMERATWRDRHGNSFIQRASGSRRNEPKIEQVEEVGINFDYLFKHAQ